MYDPYTKETANLLSSASSMYQLSPDDETDIPLGVKALRIWNPNTTPSNVVFITLLGETVSLTVPANSVTVDEVRISRLMGATTAGVVVHGYTDATVALAEIVLGQG